MLIVMGKAVSSVVIGARSGSMLNQSYSAYSRTEDTEVDEDCNEEGCEV